MTSTQIDVGKGPARERRALARCVADPGAFVAAWGRSHVFSPAPTLPRSFDDLLTLEDVDELLSRRGLRTPFLRMANEGVLVESSRFTRPGGVGAEIADQVDDTAVARLFAGGTTIVLQALHRIWPPLIAFAGELRSDLGHPVQINAYVTPAASRGFGPHYDVHDVFVLQLAGEKRWIVHPPVIDSPLRSQPWTQRKPAVERAVEDEPALDVVLGPGDSLYLPRGFLHAAEALGAVSAHLTVGIHVVTRQSVLEALLGLAEVDSELRRSLPLGFDPSDSTGIDEEVAATIDALGSRLDLIDSDDVAEKVRAALATAMRPEPVGPLAQTAASSELTTTTRVRLRSGLEVRCGATETALVLPGRTLELDLGATAALQVLGDGEPHRVGELPGEPQAVADLVRRLLAESVIVPVVDPRE